MRTHHQKLVQGANQTYNPSGCSCGPADTLRKWQTQQPQKSQKPERKGITLSYLSKVMV